MKRTSLRTLLFGLALFAGLSAHLYATDVGDRIVVVTEEAAVKSGPTTVGHVPKGNILTVREVNGDWLWITWTPSDSDTFKGWIHRRDVIAFENALDFFNSELRSNPTSHAYNIRGMIWHDKGELDIAIGDYTDAIRLNPQYDWAYNNRGNAFTDKGEYDRAISDHTEAIRLNHQFAMAFNNRGVAHESKGDLDRAIDDYSEAIRLDGQFALAYRNRGDVHRKRDDYAAAIADYTEAIRLDRHDKWAVAYRGLAFELKDELDRAIADYTEAIRLDSQFTGVYRVRARVHGKLGKFGSQIAYYRQAVRTDSTDAHAQNIRAWALATCPDASLRDGEEAVRHATRACELTDWENVNNIDTLAAAYAEAGDFENAVRWQKKATDLVEAEQKEDYQSRLALYESGQPYHESTTAAPAPVAAAN